MKKKYLRPVAKTAPQNDSPNQASAGKISRRKLSTRQILLIVLVVITVCTAVVVPVCIFYVEVPVKPSFMAFDQERSYNIVATWKKLAGVERYDVQYCYTDPNLSSTKIIKGSTVNNRYPIERHKGTVFFRVCAVKKGKKGVYSEWITYDIEPLVLSAPHVTIKWTEGLSDEPRLEISWTSVSFRYNDSDLRQVYAYSYEYCWQAEGQEEAWTSDRTLSTSVGMPIPYQYEKYYDNLNDIWPGDITFKIRVRALNHRLYMDLSPRDTADDAESNSLLNIYAASGEYGEAEFTLTEEIMQSMMEAK